MHSLRILLSNHSPIPRIPPTTLPPNAGKIRAGSRGDFSDMDQKTLIEMKNQAKLWDRIDSKMEDKIKSLKATGTLHVCMCCVCYACCAGISVYE